MFQYKKLDDREFLLQKYLVEKLNQREIAKIIGCTTWSINNALKKHNIPIRSRSAALSLRYERKPHLSKYPLLENKDWLYKQAIVERKSYQEICNMVGSKSTQHIVQMLKKHNLFERRRLYPRVVGKSVHAILNNVAWIYNKYVVEKLSTEDIAKITDTNCGSVRQALNRWGIKVRNRIEGHEASRDRDGKNDGFILDCETLYIINGGMLGDAGISLTHNDSNIASAMYKKRSISKDYLKYECARVLKSENFNKFIKSVSEEGRLCFGKYKSKESFCFSTLSHKELRPLFLKWYKQVDGKNIKIIPEDIQLNRDSLLHWFMDDGYSYYVTKKWKTLNGEHTRKYVRVYMCTQSFQRKELDMLCSKIKERFGLTFYPRFHKRKEGVKQGSGYELELSIKDVQKFFSVIGPCPVASMEYKWKTNSSVK